MEFDHRVASLDDEDLVAADKEEKNWRGIIISLVVISTIMASIAFAIVLLTPNGDIDNNKMKLEFDHVVMNAFKIQRFNGTWISSTEIVYVDQNGGITIFDVVTNKTSVLVKRNDKTLHTMASFVLSADRQSVLFVSEVRRQFGVIISAKYAIFNVSTQTVEYLDDLFKASFPNKVPQIQFAMWSPVSSSLVVVESNDIYYLPAFDESSLLSADSQAHNYRKQYSDIHKPENRILRITRTGEFSNFVINGLPDSLYRNQILNTANEDHDVGMQQETVAIWWSADGRFLSYLSFDDAFVDASPIIYYDTHSHDVNSNPRIHFERYPRAGGVVPKVSVHVVDLKASRAGASMGIEDVVINAPGDLITKLQSDPKMGYYVTYVDWLNIASASSSSNSTNNNELLVMWSSRAQNSSILTLCDSNNLQTNSLDDEVPGVVPRHPWRCETLTTFSMRTPPNSNAKRTILSSTSVNNTRLIFFAIPRPDSLIGEHYHVAMLKVGERSLKYLTHGEFETDRFLTYDSKRDILYFEVKLSETGERHLYSISNIVQSSQLRQTLCLTCEPFHTLQATTSTQQADNSSLDATTIDRCGYNYVHINPGEVKYIVHECLGPQVPITRMLKLVYLSASSSLSAANSSEQLVVANELASRQVPSLVSMLVLNQNHAIEQLLKSKQMPIEKYITIKTQGTNSAAYEVHIKMYLPNEVEEEKDKKFPLLIESTEIDKRKVWRKFELNWAQYLASRKQLIYAKIDAIPNTLISSYSSAQYTSNSVVGQRGVFSGGLELNSQYIQHSSSLPLSPLSPAAAAASRAASSNNNEPPYQAILASSADINSNDRPTDSNDLDGRPFANARDQMDIIKFLVEHPDLFPYIDKRRIAIWGPTSTSAYMALSSTIEDELKLIGCTIAVAPIINWKYMDAYTSEHYLGLPWLGSNNVQYERQNLLTNSGEFATRKLLIIHGTADEQVHVQHSMQFIKSLTDKHLLGGVIHQMQFYSDVGHSMDSVKRHFYLTLDGFVDKCFYQKPISTKATEWKGKTRIPKLY